MRAPGRLIGRAVATSLARRLIVATRAANAVRLRRPVAGQLGGADFVRDVPPADIVGGAPAIGRDQRDDLQPGPHVRPGYWDLAEQVAVPIGGSIYLFFTYFAHRPMVRQALGRDKVALRRTGARKPGVGARLNAFASSIRRLRAGFGRRLILHNTHIRTIGDFHCRRLR